MRNLIRSPSTTVECIRAHDQQISAFLLRHSRIFPRQRQLSARPRRWLQEQSFEHPADQVVLPEYLKAIRLAEERLDRIEKAMAEFLSGWHLAPVVEALQAWRGLGGGG